MDWQALRESAWRWNNAGDDAAGELCRLIPAEPNKKADAEWLEKERGWFHTHGVLQFDEHGDLRASFSTDAIRLWVHGRGGHKNPTRMTVAMFEAAAMEAMKHGE